MQVVVSSEEKKRGLSYALGIATGQKKVGSGDPDNEFQITTTANRVDGKFDGTYTITIPDGKITQAEFDAIVANPEQEDVSGELYKQLRKAEYHSLQDQLDMLWHDMENGTTNWRDHRRDVKQQFPKP
jgi:hypothetical protein